MTRTAFCLLGILALACSAPAAGAGTVEYAATFDTGSYTYEVFQVGLQTITSSSIEFSSSGAYPTFTVDFAADKQLRVTYSAPADQRFVFNPPADADHTEFGIWFGSTSFPANQNVLQGASVDFVGLEGSMPATNPVFGYVNGDFWAWNLGSMAGPFAFRSVTALYNVPDGYDASFDALSPFILFRGTVMWDVEHADPGVWAGVQPTIVETPVPSPVPEPSASLLMALVTAAGLCARRAASRSRARRER